MTEKLTYRLLADENTSRRLVSTCARLIKMFPIVHIAAWQEGSWLGLDDAALLIACAEAGLVLVAFDRATLPWHAARVLRAGEDLGEADWLEFDAMINLRPSFGNRSRGVDDPTTRQQIADLVRHLVRR